MQPFVVNRHEKIVFPSNFIPQLDLSVMDSLEQLDNVIRRDFEVKAPTGTNILQRVNEGAYSSRYELMRDVALNLFWTNRFSMTLYDKRPTRWADVPRTRPGVFLPIVTPWEDGDLKIAAVQAAYETLPPTYNREVEDRIFGTLFGVFGNRRHHAHFAGPGVDGSGSGGAHAARSLGRCDRDDRGGRVAGAVKSHGDRAGRDRVKNSAGRYREPPIRFGLEVGPHAARAGKRSGRDNQRLK